MSIAFSDKMMMTLSTQEKIEEEKVLVT